MEEAKSADDQLPVGDPGEDLMRAAFADLFGQELLARNAVACEFDPSWAVQPR